MGRTIKGSGNYEPSYSSRSRLRFLKRSIDSRVTIVGLGLAVALGAVGFVSAQIHKQGGPFFVSILPANPPTWTYTVTSDNQNELTSVEILSTSNLSDCVIDAERTGMTIRATQTDKGHNVILTGSGDRSVTASLTCSDHEKGEVFLRITGAGGITRTVGPVAGPK